MDIDSLEKIIIYEFKDKGLLKLALTHSSFGNEVVLEKKGNNERLEFLGDAVLELVVSDYLYVGETAIAEGELSKKRAGIVCEPGLAFSARRISLGDYILLGKGEKNSHGEQRDSILSDAFEALIGAIYLDGGIDEARRFIHDNVLNDITERTFFHDAKTELQMVVQNVYKSTPAYEVIEESGPPHDKTFTVKCIINGEDYSTGMGHSKKTAQQNAAAEALTKFMNEEE